MLAKSQSKQNLVLWKQSSLSRSVQAFKLLPILNCKLQVFTNTCGTCFLLLYWCSGRMPLVVETFKKLYAYSIPSLKVVSVK